MCKPLSDIMYVLGPPVVPKTTSSGFRNFFLRNDDSYENYNNIILEWKSDCFKSDCPKLLPQFSF